MNELAVFLQEQKLLSPVVEAFISAPEEGLTEVTDLSFRFQNRRMAFAKHKEIGLAWERARDYGKTWILGAREILSLVKALDPAPSPKRVSRGSSDRAGTKGVRKTFKTFKCGPDAKSAAKDEDVRRKAAKEAVSLSYSWRPKAGLFKGLEGGEPEVAMIREAAIDRISRFEVRCVSAAMRAWSAWQDACGKQRDPKEHRRQGILLEAFILSKKSATAPVNRWNQLQFLKKHLKAPLAMSDIPRPPRQPNKEGIVMEDVQAVAIQPDHLAHFEEIAHRMYNEGGKEAAVVASAVILAKDLMRLAHLNRSKCTHRSADTVMCSAYRGKARVGGARMSFKWAMTRRGVTGLDIGGIIYECWLRWSKEAEAPLDYLCLDNSNGAVVHVT